MGLSIGVITHELNVEVLVRFTAIMRLLNIKMRKLERTIGANRYVYVGRTIL
jgi:hypothetical protein